MKIKRGRIPKTWDDQLVYDVAKKYLISLLDKYREKYEEAKDKRERTYALRDYFALAVALTQLLNGCRLTEAMEALWLFSHNKLREQWVRVRKRKDNKLRKVLIPPQVDWSLIKEVADWFYGEKIRKRNVYNRIKYKFLDTNTHSFRYAFITYLCVEKELPAQIVARITQHKDLEAFSRYIEDQAAFRKFDELFKKLLEG